jgi:cytidine deaminase
LEHRSPDDTELAYLIRSLKHPDEAHLLRQVYGDAFSLVGVASTLEERIDNLGKALVHFEDAAAQAYDLITRDEADDSQRAFGQRVRDVYQMADVFLSTGHGLDPCNEVDRFTDTLFGAPFVTPRMHEEGMRLAYDASLRSAAIGRQVGAALIPAIGTPVVTGTNEVAKPGGGQYWTGDNPDLRDFQTGNDPNPLYTNRVVQELLERLAARGWLTDGYAGRSGYELLELAAEPDEEGESVLRGARATALIEFTRCMHAEQAAIVNAARAGVSTEGAILCSTTFPCHECAKLIVGAGISEVLYIEPYPKSLVSRLYRDVIDTAPPLAAGAGLVAGKVPFRPFVGVAPRRYEKAFVAGVRGQGSSIVDFDRATACPRTSGWTATMTEREAVAVKAISDVLQALAIGDAAGQEVEPPAVGGGVAATEEAAPTAEQTPAEQLALDEPSPKASGT